MIYLPLFPLKKFYANRVFDIVKKKKELSGIYQFQ